MKVQPPLQDIPGIVKDVLLPLRDIPKDVWDGNNVVIAILEGVFAVLLGVGAIPIGAHLPINRRFVSRLASAVAAFGDDAVDLVHARAGVRRES